MKQNIMLNYDSYKLYILNSLYLHLAQHLYHQFTSIKQLVVVEENPMGFPVDHDDHNADPLAC